MKRDQIEAQREIPLNSTLLTPLQQDIRVQLNRRKMTGMREDETTTGARTGRPPRYTEDITKMAAANEDSVHIAGGMGHAGAMWRFQRAR